MKKSLVIGIVVLVILIMGAIYLWPSAKDCVGEGKIVWFRSDISPQSCCEGLKNVHSEDAVTIDDKCYWDGRESGSPLVVCSDCGNGICEDIESVCGCPEDCIGLEKSEYSTVEEFCDSPGYQYLCSDLPEGFELELCDLCS